MNSYYFTITQLVTEDRPGYERVVTKIYFNMTAQDSTGLVRTQLADRVDLTVGDLTQQFISFEQITRTQATEWLNSVLDTATIDSYRLRLDAELTRLADAMSAKTTLVTHLPWDETVEGVLTIPDQLLVPPVANSLTPATSTDHPGCYLLNPDGSLKIFEDIVDPTVE
jgi:hypothetical protein